MQCYGGRMMDEAASADGTDGIEADFRAAIGRVEAERAAIAPILRYLVTNGSSPVLSEEIVARVRGMLDDLSRQLLDATLGDGSDPDRHDPVLLAALADALANNSALLRHTHALAIEWQLTERLHTRQALDPVLSPLLQALIASPDDTTAVLAMNLLASQARFCQAQRRMQHSLHELPGDLLHVALITMRTLVPEGPDGERAEKAIRGAFDESASRLGLLARLASGMGTGAVAALSILHGGVAIFLTTLTLASGQDRDIAAISTDESQRLRLALALRASGLKVDAIEQQLLAIFPDGAAMPGLGRIGPDSASALLAGAGAFSECS